MGCTGQEERAGCTVNPNEWRSSDELEFRLLSTLQYKQAKRQLDSWRILNLNIHESAIRGVEKTIFGLICDSVHRKDIRYILADYLGQFGLDDMEESIRGSDGITQLMGLLDLCGKDKRSYKVQLARCIDRTVDRLAADRASNLAASELTSGDVLGFPGNLEICGYPVDRSGKYIVPSVRTVPKYQCTVDHVYRLFLAGVNGVEVPNDIANPSTMVREVIMKDFEPGSALPFYGFGFSGRGER